MVLIIILNTPITTLANTIDIQLTFDPEQVIISSEMGYDTVDYPQSFAGIELGKPQLPAVSAYVSLPYNSTVNSVSIVSSQTQIISGNFLIYPVQPPKYNDGYTTEPQFTLPDPAVYNQDAFYPSQPNTTAFRSDYVGSTMGGVEVYPFRYNPVQRRLQIFTSLTLRITYTPPSPSPTAVRHMEDRYKEMVINDVKSMVHNPDDVASNYEPVILFSLSQSTPSGYGLTEPNPLDTSTLPSQMTYPYTYLIITNDRYCGGGQTSETDGIPGNCSPLLNWRTELGVPATMRTVQWIIDHYWQQPQTIDLQEAIRNFLKDAHQYWGTQWVILIGDVDIYRLHYGIPGYLYSTGYSAIVPARYLCSYNHENPPDDLFQVYCPCDLYYMDVTDNFDGDSDKLYGEPFDIMHFPFYYSIDMWGGRVPADTETEVSNFVSKLLHYEKLDFPLPPTNTYLTRCLQVGADFGNDDLVLLANDYLPNYNVQNILEGYQGDPNHPFVQNPDYPEPWQVVEAMNNPSGIVNFATHGHPNGYYILTHGDCTSYIQFLACTHNHPCQYVHGWNFDKALEDVDIDPRYFFLYSDSCSLHRYDDALQNVVGEEVLFNPSWGGCISIGNVRKGYAITDPSKTNIAYFYANLLNNTVDYGDDKNYVGQSQCLTLKLLWQTSFLNRTYVNQLFGCPRTSIWRGDPQIFANPSILYSSGILTITVSNNQSQPVENATVCLWMRYNIPSKYFVAITDVNGQVSFNIGSGCNNATLTISYEKYNYKPYQTTVTKP